MESTLIYHLGTVKAHIAHKGKRIFYNTKVKVPKKSLDTKGFVKTSAFSYATKLNENILLKKKQLDNAILQDLKRHGEVDIDRVKALLNGTIEVAKPSNNVEEEKFNATFSQIVSSYANSKIKLSRDRKWQYATLTKLAEKYDHIPACNLTSKDYATIFDQFCTRSKRDPLFAEHKKVMANTAGDRYKKFRRVFSWAEDEGYKLKVKKAEWDEIRPKTFKPDFIYLDEAKVQQLHDYSPETAHMQRVKEIFLVLIYTAMRYSDYLSLSPEQVVIRNEQMFIEKVAKKTKSRFKVPITNLTVQRIVQNPPKMVDQVFNRDVKTLGEKLGWNEMINFQLSTDIFKQYKFHELLCSSVGRHTAATRWVLSNIAPNVIMSWTGWTDISMVSYYMDKMRLSTYENMSEIK